MARQWTEEERRRQGEIMRERKAWEKSTGPRTAQGKATVAFNAYKHGLRSAEIMALCRLLRLQKLYVKSFAAGPAPPLRSAD